MLTAINQYKLDTNIKDYPYNSFIPLSYNMYARFPAKRSYKNEAFLRLTNDIFYDTKCDAYAAAVDNIIYIIYYALENLSKTEYETLIKRILDNLRIHMSEKEYANPEVVERSFSLFRTWYFDWGNIVVGTFSFGDKTNIAYTTTSNKYHTFTPLGLIDKVFDQEYFLGQPINDLSDLIEYTDEEYQLFEAAGAPRLLKNEKIYHATDVKFAGFTWDTVIGTTEGRIYKIAFQILNNDKGYANSICKVMLTHLKAAMGQYTRHTLLSNRYWWDSSEGNVILDMVSRSGYHGVNIFLTSNLAKSQYI